MKVYKRVRCIKETPGVQIGKIYYGYEEYRGFIKVLNDQGILTIYHTNKFEEEETFKKTEITYVDKSFSITTKHDEEGNNDRITKHQ